MRVITVDFYPVDVGSMFPHDTALTSIRLWAAALLMASITCLHLPTYPLQHKVWPVVWNVVEIVFLKF